MNYWVETILQVLFWLCASGILLTYLIYPLLLFALTPNKKANTLVYSPSDELPSISVLLAVYNEAAVIERKVRMTYTNGYPPNKIEMIIGSDCSTDDTNKIINSLCAEFPQLKLVAFEKRTGKPDIINHLVSIAQHDILLLTDSKVFYEPDAIFNLVRNYKNPKIGVVSSKVIDREERKDGIAYQEKTYYSLESKLKHCESVLLGSMIGAFGSNYSLRKAAYYPTPPNFIADDFFISITAAIKGWRCILDQESVAFKLMSNETLREFKRKTRIGAGNYQNATYFLFRIFAAKPTVILGYFLHKILRWKTPFYLILCFVTAALLAFDNQFYLFAFAVQALLLVLVGLEIALAGINVNITPLRFIKHFYTMNLAFLVGWFKYVRGIKSNTWEPTKRTIQ